MNLRLIEKRFQNLNAQANYLDYKYNPNSEKVEGLQQHAYLNELKLDQEHDKKIFGNDPFYTRTVDKKILKSTLQGPMGQFADHVDIDDLKTNDKDSAQVVSDYRSGTKSK